ncbi:MAG: J domain-containing protein [Limisphaerales bacterium]
MDYFALLEEPRRPWVEVEPLKAKFLALSSRVHPDRLHSASDSAKQLATDRYSALNAAYNCLRDTKERLGHLLELELGAKPGNVQKIPSASMDLFMEIGNTLREVDVFLVQKAKINSPLIKVQTFAKGMEWTDRLNAVQQRINGNRDVFCDELRGMNAAWESAPSEGPDRTAALPLGRLEEIYRGMSFIARWTEQIQQRIVQLSL